MPALDTTKAKLPTSPTAADTALVELVVAHGRSVQHGGEVFGPGNTLHFPGSEALHLIATGFAHEPGHPALLALSPPLLASAVPVRGVGPTINGDDGNTIRVR